jgi:hypothetical protein
MEGGEQPESMASAEPAAEGGESAGLNAYAGVAAREEVADAGAPAWLKEEDEDLRDAGQSFTRAEVGGGDVGEGAPAVAAADVNDTRG